MFGPTHRSVTIRFVLSALTVAISSVGLGQLAAAQNYKSIEPKLEVRQAKTIRGKVNQALRTGPFAADGKKHIDDYYKKFYFPSMTQYDSTSMMRLGRLRADLMKTLRGAREPKAQQHLRDLTLSVMRAFCRDNYHPAVRYNASLIMGMLDQKFPQGGANAAAPVVLSAATNDLLELLESNEFNDVKVHPSVKVGALQGLERHVQFGMDPKFADRVTKAALAVVAQDAETLEVDADVNNWMKCQAARVLARQYKDGPSKEVHTALTALIADDKLSLDDRCCVTGLLEKITFAAGGQADVTATVLPLGNLAKAVVDQGAEGAREFEELLLGNQSFAAMGRGGGNFGGGRNGPAGPKLERRELLSRLVQLDQGAKSLSAGLADQDKQRVDSLSELLQPVITQYKDSRSFDVDLIREVTKLENSVDTLIASWQPAAAVTEDDEVDFE